MNDFEKIKTLYTKNNIDKINNIIQNNSIDDNNKLLINAVKNGYTEIVELLIPYSDIDSVIKQLKKIKILILKKY